MDNEENTIESADDDIERAADATESDLQGLDYPTELTDSFESSAVDEEIVEDEPHGEPLTDDDYDDLRAELSDTIRSQVTILFSDIKGSTSYFEKKGDEEGLAMLQHHNDLLFPVIEGEGGRVVKTIGDAIMACFKDPVSAVRAAMGMQQALEEDRANTESEDEHIHIRVALHKGPGIEKDNDVYGDVVNAAAKVQQQAQPDQILITDVLLDAAKQAGGQCVKLGRAELKGKDEALDIFAVAWSSSASQQLVEELQNQYEGKLKDARKQKEALEEELESAREQWRAERRRLTSEIEGLEGEVERAKEAAGLHASEDLHAQVKFQLQEALHAREQVEQELVAAQARWEIEKGRLLSQIESLQGAALEAMAQTNNPARMALAVREQLELRLKDAKENWQMQWEAERGRLNAEIERLKNAVTAPIQDKRDAARMAVLQKLGKGPAAGAATAPAPAWGSGGKTPQQWEREFQEAKTNWGVEKDQLNLKIRQIEREMQQGRDSLRQEVFHELRGQYEPRLEAYERERKRLKDELEAVTAQLADERQRLTAQIEHFEQIIPEAQEAARTQIIAELRAEYETKMEEINRLRTRSERRAQDAAEESDAALRRANKEISRLQEEIREAKDVAFRAQRRLRFSSSPSEGSDS